MSSIDDEPRLLFPALKPFYDRVIPLSWLLVRLAIGWNLLVHGWGKLGKVEAVAPVFAQLGFEPGVLWASLSTAIEFAGGIGIILGLFTRFFAAAAAVELGLITIIYIHNGFSWLNRGYEYALMWGLILLAIALRGGGPYSLDRRLRLQL